MKPYYQDKNCIIYHGDCLEVMPTLEDKSIDMILCDLPYGMTACKWDAVIPFEPLWTQYKRLIKDNGAIVLFGSQPFTSALVMSNPKMFKYEWVWEKNKASGHLNAKKQPLRKYEYISVFYDSQCLYIPQGTVETTKKSIKVDKSNRSNTFGAEKDFTTSGITNYPTTKLVFDNLWGNNATHPTQKPVALFEYLIKTHTNEGDTVLDNCAGSGTTGLACKNTGRKAIQIEQELKYCEIAAKRKNVCLFAEQHPEKKKKGFFE